MAASGCGEGRDQRRDNSDGGTKALNDRFMQSHYFHRPRRLNRYPRGRWDFFLLRILLVGVCAGCEPESVNASGEKIQGRRQLEKMRRRDWEMERRD